MSLKWIAAAWIGLAGCVAAEDSAPLPAAGSLSSRVWADPLARLPRGAAHATAMCARGGHDLVRDVFCGASAADIRGMSELRAAFHLDAPYGQRGFTGVTVAGHTTSLSARSVSAINPRVISLRLDVDPRADLIALAFTRGEQFSELVARDHTTGELAFYVLAFEQACNHAAQGCSFGELLTPAVEENWTDVTVYDEADLTNTVLDCATCHQPNGPNTPKLLRMHELQNPWTHWFYSQSEGGRALISDYLAAKGDETLAGVPAEQLLDTRPDTLEGFTRFGGSGMQPDEFVSTAIEDEVRASAPAQPADNSVPGVSATWNALFARAQRGDAPAVPYHDVKITDPSKLERATRAYSAFRAGALEIHALPDIRDVLPDDEARLAEMGMATTPGAAGEAVLIEACSLCHNGRLDQGLSRARFRADLVGVGREEKEEAIRRLMLPADSPGAMPPPRLRLLSESARARAVEVLRGSPADAKAP